MYKRGEWKVVCDVCGFEHYASNVKKRWDGLIVCPEDFELDHPQKYIRVREDGLPVALIRREPADVFINPDYLDMNICRADIGCADFATVDNITLPGYY